MNVKRNLIGILAVGLLFSTAACSSSAGPDATVTDTTPTPPAATPPAPPTGIINPTQADLEGQWVATAFVAKKVDGTSEDMLKVYDDSVIISIDAGGNAIFLFKPKSGVEDDDKDQIQTITSTDLTFEKQGKAFGCVVSSDQMVWTDMPYAGGSADFTWKRTSKTAGDYDCSQDVECGLGAFCQANKCVASNTPPPVDTTSPTLNVTPGDGAKFMMNFVGLKAVYFTMTFSEPMDDTTLSGIHFVQTLNNGVKKTIAATVKSVSGNTYKATASLKLGKYELLVPGGSTANPVKDKAGNALDKDSDIHFTIESLLLQQQKNQQI